MACRSDAQDVQKVFSEEGPDALITVFCVYEYPAEYETVTPTGYYVGHRRTPGDTTGRIRIREQGAYVCRIR